MQGLEALSEQPQRSARLLEDRLLGHRGGDEWVAVPVAADPRAEPHGDGRGGELDAEVAQADGKLVDDLGQHSVGQFLEVEQGRAGFLDRSWPVDAQLVGLPEPLEHLGEPPVDTVAITLLRARVSPLLEQVGDLAHLGQDGASGRLGGMSGEDGPHLDLLDGTREVCGVETRFADRGQGVGQGGSRLNGGLVEAVHLLGDVDEVEVDGEGPRQLGGDPRIDLSQQAGEAFVFGRRHGVGRRCPGLHITHQRDQAGVIVALDRLVQQPGEQLDVGIEPGVGGVRGHEYNPTGHERCSGDLTASPSRRRPPAHQTA